MKGGGIPRFGCVAARLAKADPHVRICVEETLALMKPGALAWEPPVPGQGGRAAMDDEGRLTFADEATAEAFRDAVANPVVKG